MEFSFFWLTLILFFLGAYELLVKVFLSLKSKLFIISVLSLFLMLSLFLHYIISIIFFLYLFIPGILLKFYGKNLFTQNNILIYFVTVLIISCILYIPISDSLWLHINESVYNYLNNSSFVIKGLIEIYTIAQFFRFLYPSLFSFFFLIFFSYISSGNFYSFWYRTFKNFKHNFAFWTVLLWISFAFCSGINLGQKNNLLILSNILLNVALFFTCFYTIFGLLIISMILRKKGIKDTLVLMCFYVIFTISGSYLPLVFFALSGIGITDIWMNYRKVATSN